MVVLGKVLEIVLGGQLEGGCANTLAVGKSYYMETPHLPNVIRSAPGPHSPLPSFSGCI